MKGHEKIIISLNGLLADELTAINQYMVHAEMCDNWGYSKLHDVKEKRAITEMKHAEKLIERILFLEGTPIVSHLNDIHIGSNVEQMLKNDWNAEYTAIKSYNEANKLAIDLLDNGTHDLLLSIISQEEEHIDWIEKQIELIDQMGMQNYLADQV